MARKGRTPLEWVADVITITTVTPTNGRIGMLLDRDEVAEIRQVDVSILPGPLDDAADDDTLFAFAVSLDPNVIASPIVDANLEDLEVFHSGLLRQNVRVGGVGTAMQSNMNQNYPLNFDQDYPLIAGSDIGWVVVGDAAIACTFACRVFFTRRASKAGEKANVLLSRR